MAQKKAVVFVLDASASMGIQFRQKEEGNNEDAATEAESTTTKLSSAKEAICFMLSQLTFESTVNIAGIVVVNTEETLNHLCFTKEEILDYGNAIPFLNISEVTGEEDNNENIVTEPIRKPNIPMLRQLSKIEIDKNVASNKKGDIVQGIQLAIDAIYNTTDKKKFQRKLIIFTDAETKLQPIDMLLLKKAIHVSHQLEVDFCFFGLDFHHVKETGFVLEQKRFLSGLTKAFKGDLIPVSRKEELMDAAHNILINEKYINRKSHCQQPHQYVPRMKSVRKKTILRIAPNFSVEVHWSIYVSPKGLKTVKEEYISREEKTDVNKKEEETKSSDYILRSDLQKSSTYWDAENSDVEIDEVQLIKAYRFGFSNVPWSETDSLAIRYQQDITQPGIDILHYTKQVYISRSVFIGTSISVVMGDGNNNNLAVSALAQSLHRKRLAAICTFRKAEQNDPILGALFPLVINKTRNQENQVSDGSFEEDDDIDFLYFVQLPFKNNLSNYPPFEPLQDESETTDEVESSTRAYDDLIDSMMLPNDFDVAQLPNPSIQMLDNTIVNRAIDPSYSISIQDKLSKFSTFSRSLSLDLHAIDTKIERIKWKLDPNNEERDRK